MDPKFGEFPNNVIRIAAKESRETADPLKTLDEAVDVIDNQLKKRF